MIHVEGLSKRFGDRVLFEDVSWHVRKRDRIGLSGPNGSGKTTLLRMLAGLQEPDSGSIRIGTRVLFDAHSATSVSVRDRKVGYVFQDLALFPHLTVHENVRVAVQGWMRSFDFWSRADRLGDVHLPRV